MHHESMDPGKIRTLPPASFGEESFEIKETHISIVLVGAKKVYKFKKAVDLGFISQTSLEERIANCRREVDLNERLAHGIYLGVGSIDPVSLAVSQEYSGGEPFVIMRRLADQDSLLSRIQAGAVSREEIREIARKIADFHANAETGPELTALHSFRANMEDCLDTLRRAGSLPGALDMRIERMLDAGSNALRGRERKNRIVNGHGDIRLDHVYLHEGEINVIDCTEFSPVFRAVDPLEDAAFLSMALAVEGRQDLAGVFESEYMSWSGDAGFPVLYTMFEIYRAAVRAKVDTIMAQDARGRGDDARAGHLTARIQRYLSFIEESLEDRGRPSLTVFMGLPASGKSRRAQELALAQGAVRLATDIIRKRITGLDPLSDGRAAAGGVLYTADKTVRTYRRCQALTRRLLASGRSVVLDAMSAKNSQRMKFNLEALRCGIRARFVEVYASEETVAKRLLRRQAKQTVSDMKDLETWRTVRDSFEAPSPELLSAADFQRLESRDE